MPRREAVQHREVRVLKLSFFGGVHPDDHKALSNAVPIAQLKQQPDHVVIPMSMHVGAPCKPIVAVGDKVLVGQKIGEVAGLGAPIHASVSGTVTAVEPRPTSGGAPGLCVVIENDGQNTPAPAMERANVWQKLTGQEIVSIIKEAGCTGMGGAGFPAHVKLSGAIGKADTLIINGAECEPYITADHRLMLERGEKVITGARILMHALGLDTVTIAVEENKEDAIAHLRSLLPEGEKNVVVQGLHTRYPQGAEKQLIQAITGRQVPAGGLPADVGCCVFNVGTAAAACDAVVDGRPVTHRIVTVTGGAIQNPGNFEVPVGTLFTHLIGEAGGFATQPTRVIAGGPMMGFAQFQLDVPVGKGSNCILCYTEQEMPTVDPNYTCLHCGRCVRACPMHLTPLYLAAFVRHRLWEDAEDRRVMDCIECGSCAYVCPARIPLVQMFRTAKVEIRNMNAKKKEGK